MNIIINWEEHCKSKVGIIINISAAIITTTTTTRHNVYGFLDEDHTEEEQEQGFSYKQVLLVKYIELAFELKLPTFL